jgi:hypothetical protein
MPISLNLYATLVSLNLKTRLSLFALSGYSLGTLDKFDFEPDIRLVKNSLVTRAFCTCCGREIMNFDLNYDDNSHDEDSHNHDHICDVFWAKQGKIDLPDVRS